MLRFTFYPPPKAATPHSGGFTLIEVMVAVSMAAGLISLLVPALLRQVAIGEEANRLTAVEAVVSKDLDWFANYAKIWKLKSGSYPAGGTTALTNAITKTASNYIPGGAAIYEPNPDDCSTGLAAPFLADAELLELETTGTAISYLPSYEINVSSPTEITASSGGVSNLSVIRELVAVGNRIHIYYRTTTDSNSIGLNFTREASVLVEAAAWCDRLPLG
jgi:prepilin-type N-terminal cleavage/methylation domain-containing protein